MTAGPSEMKILAKYERGIKVYPCILKKPIFHFMR